MKHLLLFLMLLPSVSGATIWYVSSAATTGDGSIGNPFSLKRAGWDSTNVISAGDTIYLRGGTYTPASTSGPAARAAWSLGTGISGTAGSHTKIMPYPGEWVKIDVGYYCDYGVWGIAFYCDYVDVIGLELYSSDQNRVTAESGTYPTDICRNTGFNDNNGLTTTATGNRVINCIIHDTRGSGFNWTAPGSQVIGNIIFYEGWEAAGDDGHGHGLYMQNGAAGDTMLIKDNIIFKNFGNNIQAYAGGGDYVNRMKFIGNITFSPNSQNGPSNYTSNNWTVGGSDGSTDNTFIVDSNYSFLIQVKIGYVNAMNGLWMRSNYFSDPNGERCAQLGDDSKSLSGETITGNVFVGETRNFTSTDYPTNTYFPSSLPTRDTSFLRVNSFDANRANLAVYNWDGNTTVSVDFAGFASDGDTLSLVCVENWPDTVQTIVLSGSTVGSVSESHTTVRALVENDIPSAGGKDPTHSSTQFGAYLVLKGGTVEEDEPDPATKVKFSQEPSNVQWGSSITPAITVRIETAADALVDTSSRNVTIAILNNPGGATLSGTTTVAASSGIATFSNLSLNKPGTAYTLRATSSGLTSDTSAAFNVTQKTPKKRSPWRK